MKAICIIFLLSLISSLSYTQNSVVRIKAGQTAASVLAREIYSYPEFTKGSVFFRDGRRSGGLLNYNMLVHEMQFISEKKDTLALADPQTIRAIVIESDSFFYDRFYMKQIAGGQSIRLLTRARLRVVDKQKIGAYDMPTSNASIESYNSFTNGLMRFAINVREDILMNKETLFFFADNYGTFLPANKRSLIKLLGRRYTAGESYLKEHDVNFNKEEDLLTLVSALNSN